MNLRNVILIFCLFNLTGISCTPHRQDQIVKQIGQEEYTRIINLSRDEFDQSPAGFRQYANDYPLIRDLIPEYIEVNGLSENESRNLHWHLGQIHAFNNNYQDAISEMKQAYVQGSKTWECYVSGTIAFLEKDKEALTNALDTLRQQDNWMNIEFLEKFIRHFDQSYAEAYNAMD